MDLGPYSLKGRVAVVTGAARGAGQAIAIALARHGADVVANDLGAEACAETARSVEREGSRCLVAPADVSREGEVSSLVQSAQRWGRIDILVNNAAIPGTGRPLVEITPEQWDRVLGVNLRSQFLLCREVGPVMRRQGKGAIVNVASIAAINPYAADYSVAKAGVVMLTKVLAKELGPFGIRANVVIPWIMVTEMSRPVWTNPQRMEDLRRTHPLGRPAEAAEIAAVVAFLASDAASYVNGAVMSVTGAP